MKKSLSVITSIISILVLIPVIVGAVVRKIIRRYVKKYDQSPMSSFLFPPIKMAWHRCPQCNSLHGGMYGKGPLEILRSPEAASCIHSWKEISEKDFKQAAKEYFDEEW